MLRSWRVLRILTCKCAFRHSGVQFLMSPLSTYLRTRRFNRPTFGLTRHTNLWKNTALRDFSNIWRGLIFFLLTFWLLHLLSTDLITLLLLFNSPYCRKFLFKLPSTTTTTTCLVTDFTCIRRSFPWAKGGKRQQCCTYCAHMVHVCMTPKLLTPTTPTTTTTTTATTTTTTTATTTTTTTTNTIN